MVRGLGRKVRRWLWLTVAGMVVLSDATIASMRQLFWACLLLFFLLPLIILTIGR